MSEPQTFFAVVIAPPVLLLLLAHLVYRKTRHRWWYVLIEYGCVLVGMTTLVATIAWLISRGV